ncbi:SAV_2336 family protein [Actinacidiphila glaucinigra]|uniref:SAV_2336 N-terminal domain-related protein n=1 Tax=Actinacidiphila glaucinigra TaxID=235986 RepID=UPI00386B6C2D
MDFGELGEPLAQLQATLSSAGVELSARELSDALWLALHVPPRGPGVPASPLPATGPEREPAPSKALTPPSSTPHSVDSPTHGARSPVYALAGNREGVGSAAPVRIPGVRGLPHPLSITRGLRALKRRVPSMHEYELDETATTEAIADSGVLDAVLRPTLDRWLHLLLIVDDSLSMRIWRDTVRELVDALTVSGIFRSVRTCPLGAPKGVTSDHTIVLIVTDGVADHWYDGSAHARLAGVARTAPAAVLHMLPTRLWSSSALAAEPMTVRTTAPTPPNTLMRAHDPWLPPTIAPQLALPVPVLELAEWSLRPWAQLLASHGGVASLRMIDAEHVPDLLPDHDATPQHNQPATLRVRDFQATVSPEAYQLAGHLAAVDPLTLPVMRVVQAAALPDSNPACLSEVLLSGLMHIDDPLDGHDAFEFAPDVRAVLRTVIRAGSAQRTVDAVTSFIEPRLGRTPDFPAIIADRSGTLTLPRSGQPLAELRPVTPAMPYDQSGGGAQPQVSEGKPVELSEHEPLPRGTNNLPIRHPAPLFPPLQTDLGWVEEALANTTGGPVTLCGPPGAGKTTVALEYAYQHLSQYNLVWWVRGRTANEMCEDIAGIAKIAFPEEFAAPRDRKQSRFFRRRTVNDESTGGDTFERAMTWLNSQEEWLLIFDDLINKDDLLPLIGRLNARGRLLVTARDDTQAWGTKTRDLTLSYRATHDPLTRLPNIMSFQHQMSGLLCSQPHSTDDPHHAHIAKPSEEDPDRTGLAVLFCDLDGFKTINDRFGYDAGEAVLAEVGRRLRAAARDGDMVARLNGDVFGVLASHLSRDGAEELAVQLRDAIITPIRFEGRAMRVGASFGIGWAACGMTTGEVLGTADQRMQIEKHYRSRGSQSLDSVDFDRAERTRVQILADIMASDLSPDIKAALNGPNVPDFLLARPFRVVADLATLRGPAVGHLTVPSAFGDPALQNEVDVTNTHSCVLLYQHVLLEGSAEMQQHVLNRTRLRELWPWLLNQLPELVTRVWQQRFPELGDHQQTPTQSDAPERARQVQLAARLAKQEQVEQLKAEALERTREVQAREAALSRVLVDRSPGLHDHRVAVEQALAAGGAAAFVEAVEGVLAGCGYPDGLRRAWRLAYAPESRELMVDVDLPGQDVIPSVTGYRFKAADPPAVVPQPRKEAEAKDLYKQLVARLALRAVDEVLAVTPPALVTSVAFNGHVQAKDRATGKAVRPCLVSVRTERDTFDELVLDEPELDPVMCLRHLNAIVSQHPYDLEPVRPVVTFDLTKYKFTDEIDVVAGLDTSPDLAALDPSEFEHLVRRLFEAIGLKAWVTQASRDDGIDAIATNEDPITGGLCIIQAKRYKNVVPAEAVRALAGVMHDKAAAKSILVTTSSFSTASKDFAQRTGRMELIDGRALKALLKEHLGIDALNGPDASPDLAALDPSEFEHLVRRLFEAIGLKAWVTQASRDDGIDAIATDEDPITGGLCIIQAKRYKNVVPAEAVHALAGVMHDKAAAKSILVTTSSFSTASKDFAQRTGRMELIDGRALKALLKEHLGIDALNGLPKFPVGWHPQDLR